MGFLLNLSARVIMIALTLAILGAYAFGMRILREWTFSQTQEFSDGFIAGGIFFAVMFAIGNWFDYRDRLKRGLP